VVGDDIAPGTGLDTADGDDGHLTGGDLAGYDGLQPDDDHGRKYHRVDAVLRQGTVAAAPVHGDLDAVFG